MSMSLLPNANWLILALGPKKVKLKLFKCQTATVYYDPREYFSEVLRPDSEVDEKPDPG